MLALIQMQRPREVLTQDLQSAPSEVPLALSRAGVGGLQKAIRIRYGEHEKLIAAEIDCTVDLERARKGVHMSRFPELFEEAIEEVVIGEAFLVEELAEHIARHIVERQGAGRAEVRISATEGMAAYWLTRHVVEFQREYPGIVIEMLCDNEQLDLARREADIVIRLAQPKEPRLVARRVGAMRFALFASQSYLSTFGVPTNYVPARVAQVGVRMTF